MINHSLVDFILSNKVFLVYLIDFSRVLSSSLSLDRSLRFLWFFTVGSLGPFCMLFLLLFPYLSEEEGTWKSYSWWAVARAQPVSIYSPSYSAGRIGSEPCSPRYWAWALSKLECPRVRPWFYYQQTLINYTWEGIKGNSRSILIATEGLFLGSIAKGARLSIGCLKGGIWRESQCPNCIWSLLDRWRSSLLLFISVPEGLLESCIGGCFMFWWI